MAEVLEKKEITRYIQKSLANFADENFLALDQCDFRILKTNTYMKSSTSGTFELFPQETLKDYLNKDKILNEHIEFQQQHQILLYKKRETKLKLNYTLELGEQASHPKLVLSSDSIIPHKLYTPQELLKALFIELNKIKAQHGILIRIFDESMINHLKLLVKFIYTAKFTKKVKISLFDGIEPIITRKSILIHWFEEKENENDSQFIEVDEDELLIEFKKPRFGKNGFNAYGHIVNVEYVTNEDDLNATIDEDSISIVEDENSKCYISKKQGFVHFTNNHLAVDNKISLHEISRNARAIASQEDNNIQVTVAQYDTDRDSVGEGVSLKSQTIKINGFVGAKSIIEAHELIIEGATHQDSTQYAKHAQINRHKGKLRCHHADITLLEGGEVHATTVNIESCLGGSVYANDVTISHVKSNLKVYASNSITIKLVSGEDNLFQIGYKNIPILNSKVAFLDKDIEELKYKQEEALRHSPEKVQAIKKELQVLKDERYKIIHSYENATITVEKPFRGLNKIVFKIDEDHEVIYKTQEQVYTKFYLEINENIITLHPVKKSINLKK